MTSLMAMLTMIAVLRSGYAQEQPLHAAEVCQHNRSTCTRVQGEGLSFVTKIQPTEVEGMTSLAPGLFDIAERVRSMFSHACA